MKRHKSLIPLSHFHRKALFVCLISKRNAPDVKGYPTELLDKIELTIEFYEKELLSHFELEERKLYSLVERRDCAVDSLLAEIRNERNQLKELFKKLKIGHDPHEDLHNFGTYLESHIRKEERQLFQRVQEVMDDDELNNITF